MCWGKSVYRGGFETYHHHQLVASVISLAARFLCSASKSHPARILPLLASEPDSLRWIPVRIRGEDIQIVHAIDDKLTDFERSLSTFLAADIYMDGFLLTHAADFLFCCPTDVDTSTSCAYNLKYCFFNFYAAKEELYG